MEELINKIRDIQTLLLYEEDSPFSQDLLESEEEELYRMLEDILY